MSAQHSNICTKALKYIIIIHAILYTCAFTTDRYRMVAAQYKQTSATTTSFSFMFEAKSYQTYVNKKYLYYFSSIFRFSNTLFIVGVDPGPPCGTPTSLVKAVKLYLLLFAYIIIFVKEYCCFPQFSTNFQLFIFALNHGFCASQFIF